MLARDDLSEWVEGKAIPEANSYHVSKFLYEDIVCRHGCPQRIVLDGGRENMGSTRDLLEDYQIQNTIISSYHSQTAGVVERDMHLLSIFSQSTVPTHQKVGQGIWCRHYGQIGFLCDVQLDILRLSSECMGGSAFFWWS